MMEVSDICARLNAHAEDLARDLLPNGRKSGGYWMFSGIEDHGRSESAYVILAGGMQGHWKDEGNAVSGEERGDMLDLVQLKRCGGDKVAAIAFAKSYLGIEDTFKPGTRPVMNQEERAARVAEARARQERQTAEIERERGVKARRAKALWLSGGDPNDTAVDAYLRGRLIDKGDAWPGSLRFHEEVWCAPLRCKQPAMLASVVTAAGEQIGCHRTFLQQDRARGWSKIDSPEAKMMLGNKRGGFVPINRGSSGKSMRDMAEDEPIYVTEGIEDALCVRMLKPEARIIAAIDLGNVGLLVLPERARRLVLVADRDSNLKAQDMLERSIARQQARGLEVRLVLPPVGIKDINEWVQQQRGRPALGGRRA